MRNIITVQDAATALNRSVQRIRQMIDEDKLKGQKAGRFWVIDARSLKREMEKRERARS